eukprot:2184244-Rhodomonas_salina.3
MPDRPAAAVSALRCRLCSPCMHRRTQTVSVALAAAAAAPYAYGHAYGHTPTTPAFPTANTDVPNGSKRHDSQCGGAGAVPGGVRGRDGGGEHGGDGGRGAGERAAAAPPRQPPRPPPPRRRRH